MRFLLIALLSLCFLKLPYAQKYYGYSDETLTINSSALEQSIDLKLHLPETLQHSADSIKYPVTIIFDSQHELIYPHIVYSIDLLTNESQVPEMIIVGVPFTRSNRHYLTSGKKKEGDTLMGIQKTEHLIMRELLPLLQEQYKASEFITIIGHSRTAFLVNYLSAQHSNQIDVALSLSGFFNNEPLSLDQFKAHITNSANFPTPFHYYFTAGTSLEESLYLEQGRQLQEVLANEQLAPNFKGHFSEMPYANHLTNYWNSVPTILSEVFSAYNRILNSWFHEKTKDRKPAAPIAEFKGDLQAAGQAIGCELNPSLTQVFSLAGEYAYQQKDFEMAINFIKFGQAYYPNYLDFDLQIIAFYQQLNDLDKVEQHQAIYKEKVGRMELSEAEKAELLKNIQE
ncbi:MAG: alpha/beta hydrolase-fold protein [Bacteroidota bacterium]